MKKYLNQGSKVFSKYLEDDTSEWSADDPQLKFNDDVDFSDQSITSNN